jgi:hypothetical protein
MAIFAQPTPDENLSSGWNVQGTGAGQVSDGAAGIPGSGYAESAAIPASPNLSAALQPNSGLPYPPKAEDVGSETDGASGVAILTNPGYADGNTSLSASATSPIPSTTAAVQNPFGVNASVALTSGATATTVQVAPFTTGSPTYGPAIALTASAVTQVSVPPAGFLKAAAAGDITAATWTPTN